MSVSVIVLHYGDRKLTWRCLASLEQFGFGEEVVIVDNGADCPAGWGTVYVEPAKNLGFAAGCNLGAEHASGDVLVFLNNDTEVRPGWLEPLEAELAAHHTGAAGARLVRPDGRIQHTGVDIDFGWPVGAEAKERDWDWTGGDIDAVTGACLAIRADVFNEVGGFDTGYWNGYEDVDLCLKLRAAGYTIRYTPESNVMHHVSAGGPERWSRVQENIIRLRERWDPAWL